MEEILKNIKMQLKILGYKEQEDEKETLKYLIDKQVSQILHICGLEKIIEPLTYVIVDRVCAEFLKNQIMLGKDIGINISTIATNIKIGDVTIDFPANSSNEAKVNLILERLERKDFDFSPYAKMRW